MARSFRGTNTRSSITKIPRVKIEILTLSGSVSSSSTRVKFAIEKSFTSALSTTAILLRRTSKTLVASISESGAISLKSTYRRGLSALLAPSSVIAKLNAKSISASIATSSQVKKFNNKRLLASISSSAALKKTISKRFTSSISSSASFIKKINKTLIAAINSSSSKIKFRVNKIINGSIELYDSLHAISQRVLVFLSHIDQHGGVLFHKTLFRTLQGHIGASGAKVMVVGRSLVAAISGSGLVIRRGIKKFTASINSSATVVKYKNIVKRLNAVLTSSSIIRRSVKSNKSGSIEIAGTPRKRTSKYLSGAGSFIGHFIKLFVPVPVPVSESMEIKSRINVVLLLENIDLPIVNTEEDLIILLEIQSLDSPELTQPDYDISIDIQPVLSTELTLTGL